MFLNLGNVALDLGLDLDAADAGAERGGRYRKHLDPERRRTQPSAMQAAVRTCWCCGSVVSGEENKIKRRLGMALRRRGGDGGARGVEGRWRRGEANTQTAPLGAAANRAIYGSLGPGLRVSSVQVPGTGSCWGNQWLLHYHELTLAQRPQSHRPLQTSLPPVRELTGGHVPRTELTGGGGGGHVPAGPRKPPSGRKWQRVGRCWRRHSHTRGDQEGTHGAAWALRAPPSCSHETDRGRVVAGKVKSSFADKGPGPPAP